LLERRDCYLRSGTTDYRIFLSVTARPTARWRTWFVFSQIFTWNPQTQKTRVSFPPTNQ